MIAKKSYFQHNKHFLLNLDFKRAIAQCLPQCNIFLVDFSQDMLTHESKRGTQDLTLIVSCNDFVDIGSVARYMSTTSVFNTNHIFQPKTPLALSM